MWSHYKSYLPVFIFWGYAINKKCYTILSSFLYLFYNIAYHICLFCGIFFLFMKCLDFFLVLFYIYLIKASAKLYEISIIFCTNVNRWTYVIFLQNVFSWSQTAEKSRFVNMYFQQESKQNESEVFLWNNTILHSTI